MALGILELLLKQSHRTLRNLRVLVHDDELFGIAHRRVVFVVLAVIELLAVRHVEELFRHTLLTVSTAAQEINHASSECSHSFLLLDEQLAIGLTMPHLRDGVDRNDNEREFFIAERTIFQLKKNAIGPYRHNRLELAIAIDVPQRVHLVRHETLALFVSKLEAVRRGRVVLSFTRSS